MPELALDRPSTTTCERHGFVEENPLFPDWFARIDGEQHGLTPLTAFRDYAAAQVSFIHLSGGRHSPGASEVSNYSTKKSNKLIS